MSKVNPERTYHDDYDTPAMGEIFTYGSNLQGIHGAGAAKVARDSYGAKLGNGIGLCGQSYGIPTRDGVNYPKFETLDFATIVKHIQDFCQFTINNPKLTFFVTRIACGLAGFKDSEIAPLFKTAINCCFPSEWEFYFKVVDELKCVSEEVEPAIEDWASSIRELYSSQDIEHPDDVMWRLWSFKLKNFDNTEPDLNFPNGPYWVDANNLVRAYIPFGAVPKDYWSYIEENSIRCLFNPSDFREIIEFSTMYPKPKWWPFESSLPSAGVQIVDARLFNKDEKND